MIKIKEDATPLILTKSELLHWCEAYKQAFLYYCGALPDFEDWVRRQLQAQDLEKVKKNV
jgi:hypothetical protein